MNVTISIIKMKNMKLAKFLNDYLDYLHDYCCTVHVYKLWENMGYVLLISVFLAQFLDITIAIVECKSKRI